MTSQHDRQELAKTIKLLIPNDNLPRASSMRNLTKNRRRIKKTVGFIQKPIIKEIEIDPNERRNSFQQISGFGNLGFHGNHKEDGYDDFNDSYGLEGDFDFNMDDEHNEISFRQKARRMSMGLGMMVKGVMGSNTNLNGERRESLSNRRGSSTNETKARRGSLFSTKAILSNIGDPHIDPDVNLASLRNRRASVAINKALHDDLVHQSRGDYQIRQANAEFLANNLNHLPEDMDLMTQGQLSEKFAEELQHQEKNFADKMTAEMKEFDEIRYSFGMATSDELERSFVDRNRMKRANSLVRDSSIVQAREARRSIFEQDPDRRNSVAGRKLSQFQRQYSIYNKDRKSFVCSNGMNEEYFLDSMCTNTRDSIFLKDRCQQDFSESTGFYRRSTVGPGPNLDMFRNNAGSVSNQGMLGKIILGSSLNKFGYGPDGKRSFKALVKGIIMARRWNVPLYYGRTNAEDEGDNNNNGKKFQTPIDFDLGSFQSDSWSSCPERVKYMMKLEPWERKDAHIDAIYRTVKKMKCFAKYSKSIKRELCRVVMLEQYGSGRIIIQQGHLGISMYFILKGAVSVQVTSADPTTGEKFTQIVSEIKAGQSFGELALVKNIRRTAAVVCKTNSEFLRLDRNDFDNVLRRSMENEWNDRMNNIMMLEYFWDWPMKELKTINIRSKIQQYKMHQLIMGNQGSGEMSECVYFVTKGRVNIVRQIKVQVFTKHIGHHNQKIIHDYSLIPSHHQKISKKGYQSRITTIMPPKNLNLGAQGSVKSRLNGTTAKSKSPLKLPEIDNKIDYSDSDAFDSPRKSTINNRKMTCHAISFKQKVETKFIVIGQIEKGEAFGFGEDLTNIYLVAATEVECLTIPSHVMVTAERHIENENHDRNGRSSKFMTTPNFSDNEHNLIITEHNEMAQPLHGKERLTQTENPNKSVVHKADDIIAGATARVCATRRKSVVGDRPRNSVLHDPNGPKSSVFGRRSTKGMRFSTTQPGYISIDKDDKWGFYWSYFLFLKML